MKAYLGIDFGGSKLLIGEIDGNGNILASKKYSTGVLNQNEATERLLACLDDYYMTTKTSNKVESAGIGIAGIVDKETGIWKTIDHTSEGNIPLAKMVSDKLNLKVILDNDVKTAVMAEVLFGRGKNCDNFIYINVGTGLGAGIIVNGKLVRGVSNNAGEIGHIVQSDSFDAKCLCGRVGCVEQVVSGLGIDRLVRENAEKFSTELKIGNERVPAADVFFLSDKKDPLCSFVTEIFMRELGKLIMNLVRIFDPELVVLGGGVVSDGWVLNKLEDYLLEGTMKGVKCGVVISSFDPGNVGLIGSGANAIRLMEEKNENNNSRR